MRPRRDSTASAASGVSGRTVYSSFSLAASVFAASHPTVARASVQVDSTPAHAHAASRTTARDRTTSAAPTLIRALHECYVAGRYRQLSSTMGLGSGSAVPPPRRRTASNASPGPSTVDLELRLKTVTDVRKLEWEIQACSTTTPLARVLPLLDRAAELGSLTSMSRLALLYTYGVERHHPPPVVIVLPREPRRAVHWAIRGLYAAMDVKDLEAVSSLISLLTRCARTSALAWPALDTFRPRQTSLASSPASTVLPTTSSLRGKEEELLSAAALWDWIAPLMEQLETFLSAPRDTTGCDVTDELDDDGPPVFDLGASLVHVHFVSALVRLREWLAELVQAPEEAALEPAQSIQLLAELDVPPAPRSKDEQVKNSGDVKAAVQAVLEAGQSLKMQGGDTSGYTDDSIPLGVPEGLYTAVQKLGGVLSRSLEEEESAKARATSQPGPRKAASAISPRSIAPLPRLPAKGNSTTTGTPLSPTGVAFPSTRPTSLFLPSASTSLRTHLGPRNRTPSAQAAFGTLSPPGRRSSLTQGPEGNAAPFPRLRTSSKASAQASLSTFSPPARLPSLTQGQEEHAFPFPPTRPTLRDSRNHTSTPPTRPRAPSAASTSSRASKGALGLLARPGKGGPDLRAPSSLSISTASLEEPKGQPAESGLKGQPAESELKEQPAVSEPKVLNGGTEAPRASEKGGQVLHESLAAPEEASLLRTDQMCARCGQVVRNGALDRRGRVFGGRECRLASKAAR